MYLGDLRSFYENALSILMKCCKSKIEVVQEQKTILGILSSICLDSSQRALDLND